jgi:hypothetical protein
VVIGLRHLLKTRLPALRIGAGFRISLYPTDGDNVDALLKIADEDFVPREAGTPQAPGAHRQSAQSGRLAAHAPTPSVPVSTTSPPEEIRAMAGRFHAA